MKYAFVDPDLRVCTLCGGVGHTAANCRWNKNMAKHEGV